VQWYAYVPALEKVAVTVAPAATLPQSGPLSNVTVCAVVSPFAQVTVPSALTVTVAGVNAKF
jgi:hypothetical protein